MVDTDREMGRHSMKKDVFVNEVQVFPSCAAFLHALPAEKFQNLGLGPMSEHLCCYLLNECGMKKGVFTNKMRLESPAGKKVKELLLEAVE